MGTVFFVAKIRDLCKVMENPENKRTVIVPYHSKDLKKGLEQAYEMAVDALGLSLTTMEDRGEMAPTASEPDKIDTENGFLVIVEFDMADYRRKHCSRAVKKTLSIPEWLNEAAIQAGVNFSQTLQEALMVKLNINK